MFRVNQQAVFDRVKCNELDCEECDLLESSVEEDGIDYICNGNKFDCPQVDTKKAEIEEFQTDNAGFFELIEWTD